MEDYGDDDEAQKPRRLDDDTVTYLTQLDVQLSAEDLDAEGREILVENVLSEIKQKTASAACDRRTNMIIEKLCYAASLPHLIEIISRCTPYAVFLARNRHSSHILQAILARLCYILKNNGIGNVNEEELKNNVLGFLKLILNEVSWLVKELSASHVIRSAFCALAGIPIITERKGKGSKHQHSVSLSEPLDSLMAPKKFHIDSNVSFSVPEEFHDALGEAAVSLLSLDGAELQSMIADSSSCAVLGLLLRILYAPDIVDGGPALAERLARTALECPSTEDVPLSSQKANAAAVTLFYAMAGDKSGSYFLEAVVECCGVPLLVQLLHGALKGSCKDYAEDGAGNFVLQATLRRLSAELERKARSSDELEAIEEMAATMLGELTADEIFLPLALSKGGVILWLLELCRWTEKNKGAIDWAEKVGSGQISAWTNEGNLELCDVLALKLAPKAASEAQAAAGPLKKINGRIVVDKDSAQLLMGRLICALLKLDNPSLTSASTQVAEAVYVLPIGTLKHVATSGPLSKSVLDTIIDIYQGTDASLVGSNILLSNISTLSAELADHFIGQHVLKRGFEKGSAENKESIVVALDGDKEKLGRSKEGRNSLRIVQAELFARKPDEWRALLRKQGKALEMLHEIEYGSSTAWRAPNSSSSGAGGEKERGFPKTITQNRNNYDDNRHSSNEVKEDIIETTENDASGSRKRKRKRPGKKSVEDINEPSNSSITNSVVKEELKIAVVPPVKVKIPNNTGERNIDMRKIQSLRSGKVTSLLALSEDIATMAKSKNK